MGKKIIIHCSDSSWGNSIAINKWHTETPRNWSEIGYHYVILNGRTHSSKYYDEIADGLVETGRRYNTDGAHCKGQNNGSIGVCLIGLPGEFTDDQYFSLSRLIKGLREKYKDIELYQHSDFDTNKPFCANLDWNYISESFPNQK